MTAKELIELLEEVDPKTPILMETIQEVDGFCPTTFRDLSNFQVVEDMKMGVLGDGSYCEGQHVWDNPNKPDYPDVEPVQVVVLSNR